jgi:hypothetical protein
MLKPTDDIIPPSEDDPEGFETLTVEAALSEIFDNDDPREKFVPVTRGALMERLTRDAAWPAGMAADARRFFRYLDHWRAQMYLARELELERIYEPFSPDTDLLITRRYAPDERLAMQKQVVVQVEDLLRGANYTKIDTTKIELILTKDSHYGLDLHVDLQAFEELLIYYRGANLQKATRRNLRQLYLRKEEFDVPIFQRLFILFKIKPENVRIREIMTEQNLSEAEARKIVHRMRRHLPMQVVHENIYMKLFKNIPRTDLEMCFPNTRIKFRLLDKLKLGVTAGGGLGMGAVASASKIALMATNPVAAAGAAVGLGGVAFRQAMNFVNMRNRYMVTMAQNLYFHSLAVNRGAVALLGDRAAEEDVKEEMLLYCVLAKATVNRRELKQVDVAIEQYMLNVFGLNLNFDIEEALSRLIETGIVEIGSDGTLHTLPPAAAARQIDFLWDRYLDNLPDPTHGEGVEFDFENGADA